MYIRICTAAIYLFLLPACRPDAALADFESLVIEEPADLLIMREEMIARINEARSQSRTCGATYHEAVPPLNWSPQLAEAAWEHSADMAKNNHFNHEGSDGSTPGDRIRRQGYAARAWGENIAAGYPKVEDVVRGWLESPGHCANIMSDHFQEFGAAYAENASTLFGIFWTQVFATP